MATSVPWTVHTTGTGRRAKRATIAPGTHQWTWTTSAPPPATTERVAAAIDPSRPASAGGPHGRRTSWCISPR